MRITRFSVILCVAFLTFSLTANAQKKKQKAPTQKEIGLASISRATAESIIEFLACDELEGRESGYNGANIASRYIASQLKQMGIAPLLPNGYYQEFSAYSPDRQTRKRFEVHPDSIAKLQDKTHRRLNMRNVLAMIPGERTDEYVIVGAHFDHLGLDDALEGDQIYNGADDNASGVSAVLQIAKAFLASGKKPLRNVIFAFWDGEERGLLGSKYFVHNCPFISQVKSYLNFDMIGRDNKPEDPTYMVFFFTASHPAFGEWLKNDVENYGLKLNPSYRSWDNPVSGSDNASFAVKGIPILWYHTDAHPDYHAPGDSAERLNWDKVVDITKASYLNAWNMANVVEY